MPINPKKLKAGDIRTAMLSRWSDPEYAVMFEVREATGVSAGRSADAVIMSLWPSRGLELHGVEIKVSRSDWKREAADPTKAEAIARYCDRWWIHTPPGVVDDVSDMPPAWGLREFDGQKWATVKEAEKTDALPVTRPLLAAILRRADTAARDFVNSAKADAIKKARDDLAAQQAEMTTAIDRAARQRTENLNAAEKKMRQFEAAFGAGSANDFAIDHQRLGAAALALSKCHTDDCWRGSGKALIERLRTAANEIEAVNAMLEKPVKGMVI